MGAPVVTRVSASSTWGSAWAEAKLALREGQEPTADPVDEPSPESLTEKLSLPPDYEHLRDRLEGVLTPLPDTRAIRAGG